MTSDLLQLKSKVSTEALYGVRQLYDSLTPHEKELAIKILEDMDRNKNPQLYKTLWELDYVRRPVSAEEFINSEYYLGKICRNIYPPWRRDLAYVLDPKNEIFEWICTGSIGSGKTNSSLIAQMYKLYFLSCIRKPAEFFGLMETTLLVFMFFSLTAEKAEMAVSGTFKTMLEKSPYFIDTFPTRKSSRRMKIAGDKTSSDRELLFPKGIAVITGSRMSHALSFSVFSAVLDEVNFRSKKTITEDQDMDSAVQVYEETASRIQSRFMAKGVIPGILCTVSSKKSTTDFIDRHIEKVRHSPNVYISDYKIWDVKPDRIYSGKRFFIKLGGSPSTSYVVDSTSDEDAYYRKYYEEGSAVEGKPSDTLLPKSVMSVPVEYYDQFIRDFTKNLQNLAGVATEPFGMLFDNPMILKSSFETGRASPFNTDVLEAGVKGGQKIKDSYNYQAVTVWDGRNRMPKFYPRAIRFAHIDLAKGVRDSVGISVGCISKLVWVEVVDVDGSVVRVPRPEIFVDFVIKIRAPRGDEVYFDEIRNFLGWLRDSLNYKLELISYDQYNSIDSLQLLQKQNFQTRYLSVDRNTRAYMLLKETIVEDRLKCYDYAPVYEELRNLIYDQVKDKVDHPQFTNLGYRGSKDVADALAGMVKNCHDALTDAKLPGTRTQFEKPLAPTSTYPGSTGIQPKDDFAVNRPIIRRPFEPEITQVFPTTPFKAKM